MLLNNIIDTRKLPIERRINTLAPKYKNEEDTQSSSNHHGIKFYKPHNEILGECNRAKA